MSLLGGLGAPRSRKKKNEMVEDARESVPPQKRLWWNRRKRNKRRNRIGFAKVASHRRGTGLESGVDE